MGSEDQARRPYVHTESSTRCCDAECPRLPRFPRHRAYGVECRALRESRCCSTTWSRRRSPQDDRRATGRAHSEARAFGMPDVDDETNLTRGRDHDGRRRHLWCGVAAGRRVATWCAPRCPSRPRRCYLHCVWYTAECTHTVHARDRRRPGRRRREARRKGYWVSAFLFVDRRPTPRPRFLARDMSYIPPCYRC